MSSKEIDKAGLQRFYNSEETSDVSLVLSATSRMPARRIHAHKVILAAASEYFKKIMHSAPFIEAKSSVIAIDSEDVEMLTSAIQFIYGFDFPKMPETIHDVARILTIVAKYGIPDLLKWVTVTADSVLTKCLGDEEKLRQFLAFDRYGPVGPTSGQLSSYAIGCLHTNLKKLRGEVAFQDLLRREPKLAVTLLDTVVYTME